MHIHGEPLEIERKFLIRYPDLAVLERQCSRKAELSQTYLQSKPGISRRIRKRTVLEQTEYWYSEKEKLSDITRIEREHQITEEEYQMLLQEAIPEAKTICKTRYHLPFEDLIFEVDLFPEWTDRAYVEVELEGENQAFHFPDCLEIIKEVTADHRYTNASLSLRGFVYEDITG